MGLFLDCRADKNFTKLEISEEITNEKEQRNGDKNDVKNNNTNNILNKKINKIEDNTDNEDDIIINTDEEKSYKDKDIKINTIEIFNRRNENNNNNKINNTIFINNSNVTISQRNNKEEKKNKSKEDINEINEIRNDFKRLEASQDNLELNNLLSNVFNNNSQKNISYNNTNDLLTESNLDFNYNKEYFDNLYTEQKEGDNINHSSLKSESKEKIINKLKQLKEKINNKNRPKEKDKKKYRKENYFSKNLSTTRSLTITNKQIRKNIPSYRQKGFFNPLSFNKSSRFRKYNRYNNYSFMGYGSHSLANSFNKSLYSSILGESMKDGYLSIYNDEMTNTFTKKKLRGTPSIYSAQKSYLNNSSIYKTSSYAGKSYNNKNKKYKRLYNVVSKDTKYEKKNKTIKSKNRVRNLSLQNELTKFDLKKEIEKDNNNNNNNNLLYHNYRDIIEINFPNDSNIVSLVDKSIYKIKESNNKIILNYNKLINIKTSIILYDGILYKVSDKKNSGFKLSKRYFQIYKNCFRYFNNLTNAKNKDKPLVQFDVRYIKDLQIIDNDFLNEYQIENKNIEIVFCVYLIQNYDFFVFAFNDENFGKNVFNILKLLKNYYEDKK